VRFYIGSIRFLFSKAHLKVFVHWEKSWENFGKTLHVSQNFPIFLSKWANYSPILRKKWENLGKHTQFSRNFLAIFPSVCASTTSQLAKKCYSCPQTLANKIVELNMPCQHVHVENVNLFNYYYYWERKKCAYSVNLLDKIPR